MQPVIGKIEQLTNRPSPPSGGSGVPNKPCFDLSKLDEAQQKADKLKATLLEIQELSKTILDDLFTTIEKTFEKTWEYQNKRHEEIKHEITANQERIRKWRS